MVKWFNPEQQRATAQVLRQQAITPTQGQMVSGRYVGPTFADAISKALLGYTSGKLSNLAQKNEQEQQSALTRALLGQDGMTGPEQPVEQRLAGVGTPQAQQMAQQLALGRIQAQNQPKAQVLSKDQAKALGLPETGVYQQTPTGEISPVYEQQAQKLPSSVQEFQYAQQNPDFAKYQLQQKKAGATNISTVVGGQKLTPAEQSIDKSFGEEVYYPSVIKGGIADTEAQIQSLSEVAKKLETSDSLSGPLIGMLPEGMRSKIAPESMDAQQLVEQTVQRSLKDILGGQFAQQEAIQLMARAYNPSLDESFNKPRVQKLIKVLQNALDNKKASVKYFEDNGTLRGFKGELPSMASIVNEFEKETEQNGFSITAPNGKTYTFDTQEQLNNFKSKAGL